MRRDRFKYYINSKPKFEKFRYYEKCRKRFFVTAYELKRQYSSKRTISSFYNKNDNPKFHDNISYTKTFMRYTTVTESITFYGD